MERAVIIGGTGAIGRATARRLLAAGWSVALTGRDPARMPRDITASGGRFIAADGQDSRQQRAAFAGGADLLVDCACYTARDATGLLPLARDAASTVLISSKAVYVDAAGRHSNSPVTPDFGGPVREDQPTVAPGHGDHQTGEGYPANKVAAEQVLLDSGVPVTVLRPSKIHGPGSRRPREWMFVKRALDRRPVLVLAHRGAEVDWLAAAARGGEDADLIPGPGDSYFAPLLDYPAEDRWLASRTALDVPDTSAPGRSSLRKSGSHP